MEDMEAVIAAARKAVDPIAVDAGQHLVFLPLGEGGEGQLVSLEKYHADPTRMRGQVDVFDVASFNIIVASNDHGATSIYLDRSVTAPAIVGILNGADESGPGWNDYRVNLVFRETPQWAKWRGMDGRMMPQAAFAEFIEDNLADIADPPSGAMLEIATYLQVTRVTDFKSATRLSSGAIQFQNVQTDDAKVAAGSMAIPETFKIGLPLFQGGKSYAVVARFRYRLTDGKLTLGFKLQRVEDIVVDIFNDLVAQIERGTNVSVLEGTAPKPVTAI
jgi:uncharacterized protein YfdQ (DUF2303 family)